MGKKILIFLLLIAISTNVYALNLSRVKTWGTEVLTAADLNAEFDNILNHPIANADVSASAAILGSKIDLTVGSAIGSTTPSTGAFTTLSSSGATTIGDAPSDTMHYNANVITYEGATADDFETTLAITDPTADRTATLPDHTGTIAVSGADFDLGAFEVRAQTLESDVTTGTAPFTVASTTKVANLNSDTLDGTNSSTTAAASSILITGGDTYLPDDSVDTTALKTSSGSVSNSSVTIEEYTLPGGAYGFYPQIKMSDTSVQGNWLAAILNPQRNVTPTGTTSYVTTISLGSSSSKTIYAQQTYVTASGIDHWIFVLLDKANEDFLSGWEAPDHPSYGNGGNPEELAHPFRSYNPSKHIVVLIDKVSAEMVKLESQQPGTQDILTLVADEYKTESIPNNKYIPLHSGRFINEDPVLIENIPEYIEVRKLVEMTEEEKKKRQEKLIKKLKDWETKQLRKKNARKKMAVKLKSLGLTKQEIKDALGLDEEEVMLGEDVI